MQKTDELDKIDRRIIDILLVNGRISVTELAGLVGISKTPCHARIRKLEASGAIKGYRAIVDPGRLGLDHIAFVQVSVGNTTSRALAEFNTAVMKVTEVEQCHMIAGSFDYLLKVRTADIVSYRQVLGEKISALPHVTHTSTFVSMESVKEATGLELAPGRGAAAAMR